MNRSWTIYLVQHAHTDLGYTHSRDEVDDLYLQMFDALPDMFRRHADLPEGSRFKWTVENFWQFDHYVRHRPAARVDALLEWVRQGYLEISGSYLNMTNLTDAELDIAMLEKVDRLARQFQIPLRSAMQIDGNGYNWTLPRLLNDLGVDNLCIAANSFNARRVPGDPNAIRWGGPGGGELLVWNSTGYLAGTFLFFEGNLHGVRLFPLSVFERFDAPVTEAEIRQGREKIAPILEDLEKRDDYPYNICLLLCSGYNIDNAPPNPRMARLAALWNRTVPDVKIKVATITEWFDALRPQLPGNLPLRRQYWNDYWQNGLSSCSRETAGLRAVSFDLEAARQMVAGTASPDADIVRGKLARAVDNAILGAEHTYGCFDSEWNWYGQEPQETWNQKRGFFLAAAGNAERARKMAIDLYAGAIEHPARSVLVYNPHGRPFTGTVEVEVPATALEGLAQPVFADADGHVLPTQPVHGPFGRWGPKPSGFAVAVKDVPPTAAICLSLKDAGSAGMTASAASGELENRFYRLDFAPGRGLVSLKDKATGKEFFNRESPWGPGMFFSDELEGPSPRTGKDCFGPTIDKANNLVPVGSQVIPATVGTLSLSRGSVFDEAVLACTHPYIPALTCRVRLHHAIPLVEWKWEFMMPERWEQWAGYFAFPWLVGPAAKLKLQATVGEFEPGSGQIEGTCYENYPVDSYAVVEDGPSSFCWSPRQAPLIELNQPNLYRWPTRPQAFKGTILSEAFNNYWQTNFPMTQAGLHRYDFAFTSVGTPVEQNRRLIEWRHPLPSLFVSDAGAGRPCGESLVAVDSESVLLQSLERHSGGRRLRLRNLSDMPAKCSLRFGPAVRPVRVLGCDVFGRNPEPLVCQGNRLDLTINGYEVRTIVLE